MTYAPDHPLIDTNDQPLESEHASLRLIHDSLIPAVADNGRSNIVLAGRLFLISDVISMMLAFILGGVLSLILNDAPLAAALDLPPFALPQELVFAGIAITSLFWFAAKGHYRQRLPFWESLGQRIGVCIAGFIISSFVLFTLEESFSRVWLGMSWLLFAVFLILGRHVVITGLNMLGRWQAPVLLIGDSGTSDKVVKALTAEKHMGYCIVDQLSSDILYSMTRPHAWKRLRALHRAEHLILALSPATMDTNQAALKMLARERVSFTLIPAWNGLPVATLSTHSMALRDLVMLQQSYRLNRRLPRMIKRCFDLVVSSIAIFALMPLFLIVAILIRRDGGPAFFAQPRIGLNGKSFSCYKFRSMRVDAEEYLQRYLSNDQQAAQEWNKFQKLKQDIRITRIGHFIRKTSIDELPQLLNVFKGDMSLVGPRPILPGQEEYYGDDFIFYTSVRPGITGPWQVSGRNKLTFKERVALEAYYTRNWTLGLDIIIMLKTLPALLKKDSAF